MSVKPDHLNPVREQAKELARELTGERCRASECVRTGEGTSACLSTQQVGHCFCPRTLKTKRVFIL